MGTGVIANSLFLCFLAVLPRLEYWQTLGRSDMQNHCQEGLMWKECVPPDFPRCVFTFTRSYLVAQLQWNLVFFTCVDRTGFSVSECALHHKLTGWTCSWGFRILLGLTGLVLVKQLQVSVTQPSVLSQHTLGFDSDLIVSQRDFHTSQTGK